MATTSQQQLFALPQAIVAPNAGAPSSGWGSRGVRQPLDHVIEYVYNRRSATMKKPTTLEEAKHAAAKYFKIPDSSIERLELSYKRTTLASVVCDDAAWLAIPNEARVQVKLEPIRRGRGSQAASEARARAAVIASLEEHRNRIIAAARQARRAQQAPYQLPQITPRTINRMLQIASSVATYHQAGEIRACTVLPHTGRTSDGGVPPRDPEESACGQDAIEAIAGAGSGSRVIGSRPHRHTHSYEHRAFVRASAPSPAIVAEIPDAGPRVLYRGGRSLLSPEPTPASALAPIREVSSVSDSAVPAAEHVASPPRRALALQIASVQAPVTTVRVRCGGTYLRPVPQETWDVNVLPADFCFRHLRQNVASKKGEIPDRIKLTYKGVPLRDGATPSDVNMKNGETVLFFIDRPRLQMFPPYGTLHTN